MTDKKKNKNLSNDKKFKIANDEKYRTVMAELNCEEGDYLFGTALALRKNDKLEKSFQPYNMEGVAQKISLNRLPCHEDDVIIPDDGNTHYICGQFTKDRNGYPILKPSQIFESEESFRKELQRVLYKGKLLDDEALAHDLEVHIFDGKPHYASWFAKEIAVLIEEEYRAKIKETEDELQKVKADVEEETRKCDDIKQEIKNNKGIYDKYVRWGIIKEDSLPGNKINVESFSQLIEDVWKYLENEKKLHYKKEIVRCFLSAMRTQQLIILWGRPGTGKTSLPKAVAEALGAKCTCIQVQSNWTDNQDLLGYYNPVDKIFVATEFLDALVTAKQNPEILHFIILDEMNLSCVEYYFSEMLNYFTRGEDTHKLNLYSKRIEDHNKPVFSKDEDTNECKIEKNTDSIIYPSSFFMPYNVIIVGTLNSDETTKSISPKVIDRSCLIELTEFEASDNDVPESSLNGKDYVSPSVFNKGEIYNKEETADSAEVKKYIANLKDRVRKSVSLSRRLDLYVDQWMAGDSDSHCTPEECIDDIVLTKVLPLFNGATASGDDLNSFKEVIEELDCSIRKFNRMLESSENGIDQKLEYWEK